MTDACRPLHQFETAVQQVGWSSLFPALDELCQTIIGHRLFSCSTFRMEGPQKGVAARIYTSDEVNYPRSGEKEIVPNRWTEQVIAGRQIFVANSVEGFADVFADHERIASLGLGSVVNIPVILRGDFIGTVNLLHEADYYGAEKLARITTIILPAIVTFGLSSEAAWRPADPAALT